MWLDMKQWFKQHDYAWNFKIKVCLPLLLGLIFVDWLTKGLVMGMMAQGDTIVLIPNFIVLKYVINPGSAYGVNADNPTLAITLASLVTVGLIIFFLLMNDKKYLIAIAFLLGGSLANLLGRAWTPITLDGIKGGVIDFLQWGFSALNSDSYVFNIADVNVIVGICILLLVLIIDFIIFLKKINLEKKQVNSSPNNNVDSKSDNEKGKADDKN